MMNMTNGMLVTSLRFFIWPLVKVAGGIEALYAVPGASLPGRSELGVRSPPSSFVKLGRDPPQPIYKRYSLSLLTTHAPIAQG